MNTKLNTKYIINKEKRTIVCIIEYALDCCAAAKVTGIAYCDPNDEWNEDLGRRLAAARAQAEMHLAIRKQELADAEYYMRKAEAHYQRAARHSMIFNNYRERVQKLRHGILED